MSELLKKQRAVTKLFNKFKDSTKKLNTPKEFETDTLPTLTGDIEVEYQHFVEQHLEIKYSTAFRLTGPKTGQANNLDSTTKLTWNQGDRKFVTGEEKGLFEKDTSDLVTSVANTLAEVLI